MAFVKRRRRLSHPRVVRIGALRTTYGTSQRRPAPAHLDDHRRAAFGARRRLGGAVWVHVVAHAAQGPSCPFSREHDQPFGGTWHCVGFECFESSRRDSTGHPASCPKWTPIPGTPTNRDSTQLGHRSARRRMRRADRRSSGVMPLASSTLQSSATPDSNRPATRPSTSVSSYRWE